MQKKMTENSVTDTKANVDENDNEDEQNNVDADMTMHRIMLMLMILRIPQFPSRCMQSRADLYCTKSSSFISSHSLSNVVGRKISLQCGGLKNLSKNLSSMWWVKKSLYKVVGKQISL